MKKLPQKFWKWVHSQPELENEILDLQMAIIKNQMPNVDYEETIQQIYEKWKKEKCH